MRKINRIVIHCTDTSINASIADIKKIFKDYGWNTGGYHIIIDYKGTPHKMYDFDTVTNGAKGYNLNSIHIAYIGGKTSKGEITDTRSFEQKTTLRCLLKQLRSKYPNAQIIGHRDLSPDINNNGTIEKHEFIKKCPCFDAKIEYSDI